MVVGPGPQLVPGPVVPLLPADAAAVVVRSALLRGRKLHPGFQFVGGGPHPAEAEVRFRIPGPRRAPFAGRAVRLVEVEAVPVVVPRARSRIVELPVTVTAAVFAGDEVVGRRGVEAVADGRAALHPFVTAFEG